MKDFDFCWPNVKKKTHTNKTKLYAQKSSKDSVHIKYTLVLW